jgi:hypothetical protein
MPRACARTTVREILPPSSPDLMFDLDDPCSFPRLPEGGCPGGILAQESSRAKRVGVEKLRTVIAASKDAMITRLP